MKTLTLLRHAKSSWDSPAKDDFERSLNRKGHRAAQAIGRALRARGLEFDAAVASPAIRVVETIAGVEETMGRQIQPLYDRRLYLASPATLLSVVREASDSADRLLLVGHNPGLEALALLLTRDVGNGLRAAIAEKYPTGAVAQIELPIDRWKDAAAGTGELSRFIRPRDLDPELGPESDS